MSSAGTIASGVAAGASGGSVLGPLGALAGGLLGAAGSWFSGKSSAEAARENYKHRYQWMVKDLMKAGLNPMLAVGSSPGSVPQPSFENIGEGATKGFMAGASAKLINAQIKQSEQTAAAQQAQAQKGFQEAEGQEMQNRITAASPQHIDALRVLDPDTGAPKASSASAQERWDSELALVKEQGAKLKADRELVELNQKLARGELTLQELKIQFAPELAEIETAYRAAMAQAAKNNVPATQADAAFWESAGPLGKFAIFLKQVWGDRK